MSLEKLYNRAVNNKKAVHNIDVENVKINFKNKPMLQSDFIVKKKKKNLQGGEKKNPKKIKKDLKLKLFILCYFPFFFQSRNPLKKLYFFWDECLRFRGFYQKPKSLSKHSSPAVAKGF